MKHRGSSFWRLFASYLLVILVSLAAITWYASRSVQRLYLRQTADGLEARARLVGELIQEEGATLDPLRIDALCKTLDIKTAMRVTVILPSGQVIGDSANAPSAMASHVSRPEIKGATKNSAGVATRFSHTLQMNMMYVAVPLHKEGEIIAIVRTSVSIASTETVLRKAYVGIAGCGVIIAILATIATLIISHRITNPFDELRRQFVANVSHELRTPITSIKGFLETLLDGAMNEPENAQRFLRIAAKQSDRLNAIVEDLLTLSRLEEETENTGIPLETASLCAVLRNGIQVCETKAQAKNVRIELQCGEHLMASINPPLLEQAIVNLVDNAIKFGPSESTVWVEARQEKKETVIHVRDKGNGIEAKHLSRLFERFYRVDKARSRSLGGTGLGLAITKHIVQLHRGRVYVDSAPGEGSVFSIYIPRT